MKRLTTKIFSVSMAGLAWLLAGETAHAVPRLTAGVVRGFPGRTVEVPIALRYLTNDLRDVVALQADVVFDATGVVDGTPAAGVITSNHVLASSTPFTGTRRLLAYSAAGSVLTNGEVARIPFTVGPNEYRNFALRLTNVILVRADASQVFGTTKDGVIVVNQVFVAPDGQVDGFLNVAANGGEQCYLIQATTNFQSWVNVQTNSTEEVLLPFIDPQAGGNPHRFYRAVLCTTSSGLPAVTIATITQLPGGRVQFDFTGANGRSYVIQASTNLVDWHDVATKLAVNGRAEFSETTPSAQPYRFFRVKSQ